jgi:hypothetical protein
MATLGGYYLNPHRTQFDGSTWAGENCTPTSGANGANAATGGKVNKSGGQIRALIARSAETDPRSPGWSLVDLDRAMYKLGVGFTNLSGQGWGVLLATLNNGQYVTLQGVSSVFSNTTCSGAFNGDHCIGIHPARTRAHNGLYLRWIDDPICKTGRYEYENVIRNYGAKLDSAMRFGVFSSRVPRITPPVPTAPIPGAPASIGPQPAGATSWVETHNLARLWQMDSHGIVRPIQNLPNGFTFDAWAGPNVSEMWAPGPNAAKSPTTDVFRRILSPVHIGMYIRMTDQGNTWHH